jgi:site-specific DNA recombinase
MGVLTIISTTEPTDSSPTGEFLETLMAAQAKLDNAIKSERTKDGMTARLEMGLPTCPVPAGYKYAPWKDDKNIPVPDEPTFSQLQQAGYDYMTGIYTQKQIVKRLNKSGFRSKKGNSASPQYVSHFLKNPFYKGIIVSKVRNKSYEGIYEKMFTPEEWYRIQEVSAEKSFTAKPKKRNNPIFPLRHFSLCDKCDSPITGNWSKGRPKRYAYYRCPNHKPSVPVDTFEKEFIELLEYIKPSKKAAERFSKVLKAKYEAHYRKISTETTKLEKELAQLEETRRLLVKKNLKGVYDDDLFREQDDDIKNKIVVKNIQINESKMEKIDIDTICETAKHFLFHVSQIWRIADPDTKQRLQNIIFPDGVYYCFPGFRTGTLCCVFNIIRESNGDESHLGWPIGLEPTTSASTELRSTTELRPPY